MPPPLGRLGGRDMPLGRPPPLRPPPRPRWAMAVSSRTDTRTRTESAIKNFLNIGGSLD